MSWDSWPTGIGCGDSDDSCYTHHQSQHHEQHQQHRGIPCSVNRRALLLIVAVRTTIITITLLLLLLLPVNFEGCKDNTKHTDRLHTFICIRTRIYAQLLVHTGIKRKSWQTDANNKSTTENKRYHQKKLRNASHNNNKHTNNRANNDTLVNSWHTRSALRWENGLL